MHRFYCPNLPQALSNPNQSVSVQLSPQESRHAIKVLRLNSNHPVQLFNGQGSVAQGSLQITQQSVNVTVTRIDHHPLLNPIISVAVALPKGRKAELIVNQLSQLGADQIIPLQAARSIVDPRPSKLQRLARTAIEAAKQSARAHLLTIAQPQTPAQLVSTSSHYDCALFADLATHTHLDAPSDTTLLLRQASRLLILIGPEGGWSDSECALFHSNHVHPWLLGPHIMRVETAAAAATALARFMSTQKITEPVSNPG